MIIGIDGNEANVVRKVGIGEYAFELLREFEQFTMSRAKFHIYLKHAPTKDMPLARAGWQYQVSWPSRLWTQFALPLNLFLRFPRPDVFFSPTHYAPRFCPVPVAISIMDISYLLYPELFKTSDLYQLKNWTFYSVKKAQKIFTISQASKRDIIKFYSIPGEKVIVTYPGIKQAQNDIHIMSDTIRQRYGIHNDYILFVGTLQPRKNVKRLIQAFGKLHKKYSAVQLVIVGKKGWLYDEILHTPRELGIEKNVLFLGSVSDDELPVLYKHALFFILPSLYEGFGLPVLEAMKYHCPVITSNVSSLPEAGGDAALYVDPLDVEDITQKMVQLIEDSNLRKKLVQKGLDHCRKFSWKRAAEQTLEELTKLSAKS